jgi:hypothetical protein
LASALSAAGLGAIGLVVAYGNYRKMYEVFGDLENPIIFICDDIALRLENICLHTSFTSFAFFTVSLW